MLTNDEIAQLLTQQRVLPIFRGSHEEVMSSLELMKPLNIKIIELTTTIPNWDSLVRKLQGNYTVGVGTIKSQEDITLAIECGAKFLVSFGTFTELEKSSKFIPVIPGAFTPSEFLHLSQSGIKIAKMYPASKMGPKYLKDLKVLLPNLKFVVTGGIGIEESDIKPWLDAGAIAVGIGSSFGNPSKDRDGFAKAVERLRTFLN